MSPSVCARRPFWPTARRRRRRTLISLTPLIDVVFILLVFFMLATSFVDWRVLDVSVTQDGSGPASPEGALLVEVRPGELRLSGRPVADGILLDRVRARLAKRPDQAVIVKPAAGVSLQRTVAVLDLLSGAGVRELSLFGAGEALR